MKVVVLTTSYPRHAGHAAGRFVADAVERLRERGVEVDVVAPGRFRHFGIAYGAGIVGNLRRRPERALLGVVQEASVHGVSTRHVDDLAKAPAIAGISMN